MLRFSWSLLKSILVSIFVFLGTVSLVTGKFPPPVQEVYHNLALFLPAMNFADSTINIVQSAQSRQRDLRVVEAIENGNFQESSFEKNLFSQVRLSQQRTHDLENEITNLKLRLHLGDWQILKMRWRRSINECFQSE